MKGREALCQLAIQGVAGGISGSLTWKHFRVYSAPRFAFVGRAIEKGGCSPGYSVTFLGMGQQW